MLSVPEVENSSVIKYVINLSNQLQHLALIKDFKASEIRKQSRNKFICGKESSKTLLKKEG